MSKIYIENGFYDFVQILDPGFLYFLNTGKFKKEVFGTGIFWQFEFLKEYPLLMANIV